MAYAGPCTVLGGLPLWAECWYSRGDGWTCYDDAGVDSLHWLKRDGTKGKEISQRMYDRIEKRDQYWEGHVIEQIDDYLSGAPEPGDKEMVRFS